MKASRGLRIRFLLSEEAPYMDGGSYGPKGSLCAKAPWLPRARWMDVAVYENVDDKRAEFRALLLKERGDS